MSVVGQRFNVNFVVARVFYAVTSRALDLKIEVEGEENLDQRPAVLMMNHQTMLDVLVVGRLMPKQTSIMAKQSLRYTPLGPFMSLAGTIFVDRGNNDRAVQSLVKAGELMRSFRLSLWMFPEGTRTSAEVPDMLPLKKGGFHMALQAGVPIIPIVAENYWRLYHKGLFASGTIKVRVLPAISTTGLTVSDIPTLATQVRDQMLIALHDISVEPSGRTKKAEENPPVITSQSDNECGSTVEVLPTDDSKGSQINPQQSSPILDTNSSNASLGSSFSPSNFSGSEQGAETEDDEGIVLVGRPV